MNDLEQTLRSSLEHAAASYVPTDRAGARRDLLARRARRRLVHATGAAALATLSVVAAVAIAGRSGTTRVPIQGVPHARPGRVVVTDTFDLAFGPRDVEIRGGTLYVADSEGSEIALVDPRTGEAFDRILHRGGAAPPEIDLGPKAVFGANTFFRTVERYALEGRPVEPNDSAEVGAEPIDLVYGNGYVWVTSPVPGGPADRYVVSKFDAESLDPVSRFRVPAIAHLAFGYGWLWVGTNQGLLRVDPQTDDHTKVARVASVSDVSAGAGGVWVYEDPKRLFDARVTRVDPEVARVVDRTPVRGFFGNVEADGRNGVWVLSSTSETERSLLRIDPASGRKMGDALRLEGGVMEMTSGLGSLWLVDVSQEDLRRIDVASSAS